MDGSERLGSFNAVKRRGVGRPGAGRTGRLGDVVQQFMDERISPRHRRFAAITEVWSVLLPEELCRHCRLGDFSGGQLKVFVDSPSYMHELRLCGPQLLSELQERCRSARVRTIKFAIG